MRTLVCITILLSTVSANAAQPQSADRMLMRGSTATIVPARMMLENRKNQLPEYQENQIEQQERRSRTIEQYMTHDKNIEKYQTVDEKTIAESRDAMMFGFRENKNEKKIKIEVNLATQLATLTSTDPSIPSKKIRVRTGMPGYSTAKYAGCYEVKGTEKVHYSREYNGAAMPNATSIITSAGIFFHQGELNSAGSHGCIRMGWDDSRDVMNLMNQNSKVVQGPMGRKKRVFDAEVCIVTGQEKPKAVKPKKELKPVAPAMAGAPVAPPPARPITVAPRPPAVRRAAAPVAAAGPSSHPFDRMPQIRDGMR